MEGEKRFIVDIYLIYIIAVRCYLHAIFKYFKIFGLFSQRKGRFPGGKQGFSLLSSTASVRQRPLEVSDGRPKALPQRPQLPHGTAAATTAPAEATSQGLGATGTAQPAPARHGRALIFLSSRKRRQKRGVYERPSGEWGAGAAQAGPGGAGRWIKQ